MALASAQQVAGGGSSKAWSHLQRPLPLRVPGGMGLRCSPGLKPLCSTVSKPGSNPSLTTLQQTGYLTSSIEAPSHLSEVK